MDDLKRYWYIEDSEMDDLRYWYTEDSNKSG